MKINVTENMFINEFERYDRVDNFGYTGLRVLYEYLTVLEDDIGKELTLDVIGVCCQFDSYTIDDLLLEYDYSSLEEMENDGALIVHIDDENVIFDNCSL